jgi:nucleotide-binding universal stress UspA family protein
MKILLATDGSSYALEAARFLRFRLDLRAVELVQLTAVADPGPEGRASPPAQDRARRAGQEWIDATRAILDGADVPVVGRVLIGDASRTLVEEAGSGEFDLVVAGVKGRGAAPFFELGGVAVALKQNVRGPLLLVRPPASSRAPEPKAGSVSPMRVLLPTYGGGEDVQVAWRMLGSFRLARGSVEIAALLGGSTGSTGGRARTRWAGMSRAERRTRAQSWLASTLPSLSTTQVVSSSLLEGRPVREIERRIGETGADLLVLSLAEPGTDGGDAARVAEELVWFAPCSVLLARSPGEVGDAGSGDLLEAATLAGPREPPSTSLPLSG